MPLLNSWKSKNTRFSHYIWSIVLNGPPHLKKLAKRWKLIFTGDLVCTYELFVFTRSERLSFKFHERWKLAFFDWWKVTLQNTFAYHQRLTWHLQINKRMKIILLQKNISIFHTLWCWHCMKHYLLFAFSIHQKPNGIWSVTEVHISSAFDEKKMIFHLLNIQKDNKIQPFSFCQNKKVIFHLSWLTKVCRKITWIHEYLNNILNLNRTLFFNYSFPFDIRPDLP
jgi:hypothetical protein